jgi:hypothetical protein
MKTIMINQITRRAMLCRFAMLLTGGVFLVSMLPMSAEEKAPPVDKTQIVGVWLAKPFDGPGTAPRIEFKEGGKFRALMQDDTEMEGTWEWKDDSTIELAYPKTERKISSQVTQLTKESMTMVSSRGRATPYVRLKSWAAKSP